MATFTIAGLTLREAVRRKTLLGALVLGMLVLGLSLLLLVIHHNMLAGIRSHHQTAETVALRYPIARSVITTLCLGAIKYLGAIFAAVLAGGAISGEIEAGLLAVILPKPIPRWQILLGKWIGLNTILVGCTLFWTMLVWASLTLQTHLDLTAILRASPYLMLFPILISTLSLTFSTFTPRLFGTVFALALGAIAWFDGVLYSLGVNNDVDSLRSAAKVAGLVVPQAYVGYWLEDAVQDITVQNPLRGGRGLGQSPRFLNEFGARIHVAHLDAWYVVIYLAVALTIGIVVFQRRDV
jgi:ABC-type transport system involved in multi-copper enzyme maturation permease subunit